MTPPEARCAACGESLTAGVLICSRCGVAAADRAAFRRPTVISGLAILQFIGGGVWLLVAAAVLSAFRHIPSTSSAADLAFSAAVALVPTVLAALQIACGVGLWRLKRYGRSLQRFFACVGLIAFPVGTIVAIATLVYLNTAGAKLLFSERGFEELTPEEYGIVSRTINWPVGPRLAVGVGIVVVGLVLVGIVAALAIPNLVRSRIAANEAEAVNTIRAFQAAETAYALANRGYFGTPECLVAPENCLTGYTNGAFLDGPGRAVSILNGYLFQFTAGPTEAGITPGNQLWRAGLRRYALLAVPVRGGVTGRSLYCVDGTGRIRREPNGLPPSVHEAICPTDWETLDAPALPSRTAARRLRP